MWLEIYLHFFQSAHARPILTGWLYNFPFPFLNSGAYSLKREDQLQLKKGYLSVFIAVVRYKWYYGETKDIGPNLNVNQVYLESFTNKCYTFNLSIKYRGERHGLQNISCGR